MPASRGPPHRPAREVENPAPETTTLKGSVLLSGQFLEPLFTGDKADCRAAECRRCTASLAREATGRNEDTDRAPGSHQVPEEALDVVELQAVYALEGPNRYSKGKTDRFDYSAVRCALGPAIGCRQGLKASAAEPLADNCVELLGGEAAELRERRLLGQCSKGI